MRRKKFFAMIGLGAVGLLITRSLPGFSFFAKIKNRNAKKVTVKINPLAVSRERSGGNNA